MTDPELGTDHDEKEGRVQVTKTISLKLEYRGNTIQQE